MKILKELFINREKILPFSRNRATHGRRLFLVLQVIPVKANLAVMDNLCNRKFPYTSLSYTVEGRDEIPCRHSQKNTGTVPYVLMGYSEVLS